jgi:hypothetical protein
MTALGTALALLPIAILGDRAGGEILRPMAFVVIGGLVTSTLFSALALPALYLRFVARPGARSLDDEIDLARTQVIVLDPDEPARAGNSIAAMTVPEPNEPA